MGAGLPARAVVPRRLRRDLAGAVRRAGARPGGVDEGGLLVAETDEQATLVAEKVALEAEHGFPAELVTGAELRRLAPYLSPRIVAAEYNGAEGKTNPLLAAPAFARAAERHGARIITGTP